MILKGGHVIDPKNGRDGVMDVAIADGKIAEVASSIDAAKARRVVDATGLYVVPGLIDLHAHVFHGTEPDAYLSNGMVAVPPDSHSFRSGQTTLVDVGGAGWRSFPQFKAQIIDTSKTRVLSFLNIVGAGMRGGPAEQDLGDMDARLTAMRIRQHPGVIVGIKVAHYSGPEWDPVTRAVEAGTEADVPVMIDFGGHNPPLSLDELLNKRLRPGDILTHAYAHVRGRYPIVNEQGQVEPYVLAARKRGVIFDVGHGGGSFLWRQAVPATKQGFFPDVISTDLHTGSMNAGMKDILNVMSKLLNLGMPLNDVIRANTAKAAVGHQARRPRAPRRGHGGRRGGAGGAQGRVRVHRFVGRREDGRHAEARVRAHPPRRPGRVGPQRPRGGRLDDGAGHAAGPRAPRAADASHECGRPDPVAVGLCPTVSDASRTIPDGRTKSGRYTSVARSTLVVAVVCAHADAQPAPSTRRVIRPAGAPADRPYSPGVMVGKTLYISGQLGLPGSGATPADLKAQTRQAMDGIGAVLKAAGLGYEHLVKCQVYLASMDDYAAMNEAYGSYFKDRVPARTTVQAAALPSGAGVEIGCIGYADLAGISVVRPPAGSLPAPLGPYSPAVWAGDTLYLSGMGGQDPATRTVAEPVDAQVTQTLANIRTTLKAAGLGLGDVVSAQAYLTRLDEADQVGDGLRGRVRAGRHAAAARPRRVAATARADQGRSSRSSRPGRRSRARRSGVRADCTAWSSAARSTSSPEEAPDEGPGIEAQARATFAALRGTLQDAGLGWPDVVSVTVYLTDIGELPRVNALFTGVLSDRPARACHHSGAAAGQGTHPRRPDRRAVKHAVGTARRAVRLSDASARRPYHQLRGSEETRC